MKLHEIIGDEIFEGLAACAPEEVMELDGLTEELSPAFFSDTDAQAVHAEKRQALHTRLIDQAEEAGNRASAALRKMSPETSVLSDRIAAMCEIDPRLSFVAQHAGMNKFMWAIAVGASGQQVVDTVLEDYLIDATQWYALMRLGQLTEEIDKDLPSGISSNPATEALRRYSPMEVRFTWITELIVTEAANIVASDPIRYEPLRVLTAKAVAGFFEYIRAGVWNPDLSEWLSWSSLLSEETYDLMRALSVEAGALSDMSFKDLMHGVLHEVHPIVRFGELCLPIAIRDAAVNLEQAIFELARRELRDEKARGDLFESVIAACLEQVVSKDLHLFEPPLAVSIPNSLNPGEVDFAANLGNNDLLIGEAKAYFVAKRHGTVINSFQDQVGKAVGQLRLRLDALKGGRPLTSGSMVANRGGSGAQYIGIAVPLHSYAGAVWNGDALAAADALYDDVSVIPIHQLILMAQTTEDAEDMCQYLRLRNRAIRKGWKVLDEADLLMAYLAAGSERLQSDIDNSPDSNAAVILRGFSINLSPGLSLTAPINRGLWRSTFFTVCQ